MNRCSNRPFKSFKPVLRRRSSLNKTPGLFVKETQLIKNQKQILSLAELRRSVRRVGDTHHLRQCFCGQHRFVQKTIAAVADRLQHCVLPDWSKIALQISRFIDKRVTILPTGR